MVTHTTIASYSCSISGYLPSKALCHDYMVARMVIILIIGILVAFTNLYLLSFGRSRPDETVGYTARCKGTSRRYRTRGA